MSNVPVLALSWGTWLDYLGSGSASAIDHPTNDLSVASARRNTLYIYSTHRQPRGVTFFHSKKGKNRGKLVNPCTCSHE